MQFCGNPNCDNEATEIAFVSESKDKVTKRPLCSTCYEAYLSGCKERCHRIDLKNEELARLLAATNTVTPDIEKALAEAALLRADCQKKMLQHFYDVSRTMPPEQGKRYLAWVQKQTIPSDSHGQMHH